MSPTAFALSCLGVAATVPDRPGGGICRVCGDATPDGWPADRLSPNFAAPNEFPAPDGTVVCRACMHFALGATWQAHAAAHPELGIKLWGQASWRSYSHFFAPGAVAHPGPGGWATVLDAPPSAPWLAIISAQGKRNLVWRGIVATSPPFPVLLETEIIWLDSEWPLVRRAFEALRDLGMPRDGVLAGDLPQHFVLKAGIGRVRAAELDLRPWRLRRPDLMRLAHFISIRREGS